LVDLLHCPLCGAPVVYHNGAETAALVCSSGHTFAIRDGIPRFVTPRDDDQDQTARSFGFKWQQLWGHDGKTQAFYQHWFLQRFGFDGLEALGTYLGSKASVLDAGFGNGQSAKWYTPFIKGHWVGLDISTAVDVARTAWAGASPQRGLVQADVLRLPFRRDAFDLALSDGVLHHTPSPRDALASLASVVRPGGEVMFYVYRRKGAIREFTDDYIRQTVSMLPPQQAWETLKPITQLGESLAKAGVTIDVPADIPSLGISAGKYDLQRFLYDHVMKMFWNEAFTFDENHHVNFDWFHPRYAHRQTEQEVAEWCRALGLEIAHQRVEVSGISVRAVKR
jgi:SAM-dependent methyltransferase